jgi:plasmid stabilization system protein ParE
MAEVTIHPEAEAEYEHALTWYLERSPQAAERFEIAFNEAIEAIEAHPEMFSVVRRSPSLRPGEALSV